MKDEPGALRDEDAFDTSAVHEWLSATVDGLTGLPTVRQYPGGASNLTYLLSYPDRELILRRPPAGQKARSAHDMRREYTVQKQLKPVYPYVPTVLALCTDPDVIGSDFYVMDRIEGIILRGDLPEGITLTPEEASKLAYRVFDRLIELHEVDPQAAGLADLGKGAGYVERQVRGWSDRYRAARTPDSPDGEAVMAWLHENQPGDVRTCVIHNDFRFDNVVLDDDLDTVGVLDWEMATLGDPLMDLAGSLAYWIQADDDDIALLSRRQPSHLPGMPTRRELVHHYCERMGLPYDNWLFYDVFGAFRLAVIMQQIYYRFHSGQTHNPAFANLGMFVGYLFARCEKKLR
ncbi:phosphotransferase family protein [Actinophytocola oryzae]|uniref:Aminoglycoside phosphotransferase (APT) family kinase protein n=1 Tax=Actinophytocola oryzae TaxID=502181 RepID=A0A4R7VQP2_9PSEU|nr:phosphotransferase family protein [Actinophytocola oryzae]TDV51994.1 aminoglycoside phosphotransferase (APT) family kinase protein [Actinophytocola oryzae]